MFSPEAPVTMAGARLPRSTSVAPRRRGGATKPAAGAGGTGELAVWLWEISSGKIWLLTVRS